MPARSIILAALACFLPLLSAQTTKPASGPVAVKPDLTGEAVIGDELGALRTYAYIYDSQPLGGAICFGRLSTAAGRQPSGGCAVSQGRRGTEKGGIYVACGDLSFTAANGIEGEGAAARHSGMHDRIDDVSAGAAASYRSADGLVGGYISDASRMRRSLDQQKVIVRAQFSDVSRRVGSKRHHHAALRQGALRETPMSEEWIARSSRSRL